MAIKVSDKRQRKRTKVRQTLSNYFPMSFKGWIVYVLSMLTACAMSTLMRNAPSTDVYVPLIFVLAVLITAIMTEGYFYGILASVTSVVAVNWAFTYPYMKINFSIYGYPLTFLTMLAVGCAVSTLTSRLKEQEKIKTESEREKTRANLLRAISHDLRTPLTSISGSIGVVLDDDGSLTGEQKRELLAGAKTDAEWLCRMVENLLSITRMSDGQTGTLKIQDEMLEEVISEDGTESKTPDGYNDPEKVNRDLQYAPENIVKADRTGESTADVTVRDTVIAPDPNAPVIS